MFDGLGSERTVTNSSQTVTGTITFEGFGATIATTGSSSNPYKFAATSGYRDDGDAGLSRVGARYYDSQAGRFITRDTELDKHPYLYCKHDPINYLDPTGHWEMPQWFKDILRAIGIYHGARPILPQNPPPLRPITGPPAPEEPPLPGGGKIIGPGGGMFLWIIIIPHNWMEILYGDPRFAA